MTGIVKTGARLWEQETSRIARGYIPVRTGETRGSVRGSSSGLNGKVVGKYTVNFIDAGSKAHEEPKSRFTKTGRLRRGKAAGTGKVLKFNDGGQTLFRRKVNKRAIAPRPFKRRSGEEGLAKVDFLAELVRLWNQAA